MIKSKEDVETVHRLIEEQTKILENWNKLGKVAGNRIVLSWDEGGSIPWTVKVDIGERERAALFDVWHSRLAEIEETLKGFGING